MMCSPPSRSQAAKGNRRGRHFSWTSKAWYVAEHARYNCFLFELTKCCSAFIIFPQSCALSVQVHIGNQNFVPSEKWQHLLRIPRDSLFCKEGARSLWTPLELRVRSLTGLPCRRFIHAKEGPPPAKLAMTPQKVEALGCKYML